MATRMVPFKFSATVTYMIEMGDLFMSFFFDGALLDGDGASIATPYAEADIPQLQFEQVGDVMWITHVDYAPRKLSRTSATVFSLDEIIFTKGPFLVRNDIENDDAVTMKYTGTLTVDAVGTLISSSAHFLAGHVGALFELTHERSLTDAKVETTGDSDSAELAVKGAWGFNTHGTWTGTVTIQRKQGDNDFEVFRTFIGDRDRNIQLSATEQEDNVVFKIVTEAGMSADFSADITANSSTTQGIVRIDSITNTTTAVCTVLSLMGGASTDTTLRWAEGAWSGVQGYPKSITFFADRAIYAAIRSGWMSRVGDFENFSAGTLDSDSFTIFLPTGNEIMWVDTVDKTIVFGTTGNPWTLQSNRVGTPLTPTSFTIDEQSGIGSADIQNLKIDNALIYVDFVQKKLMEYGLNADQQKYLSNEITVLAEHFTATSTITWLSRQKNPESIIWFGMADGTIHSFTYQRDQNVLAYASHPMSGTTSVSSGAVIPSTDEDEVWLSVERTLSAGAITSIERFTPRRVNDEDDEHFADTAVIYDSTATTTITGLDHLDGETVVILADGQVIAPAIPASGQITLSVAASVVHVGLPFTPFVKPMRLDTETRAGSSHGTTKKIAEVVLSILDSKNVRYGDVEGNMLPLDLDNNDGTLVNNSEIDGLFTGDVVAHFTAGFSLEDSILISSSQTRDAADSDDLTDPTPLTLRAIVARLDEVGR